MDRELHPVFLQAREIIEEVLDAFKYRLSSECHHPDAFGSAHSEYRGRRERVQLTWDGKDCWLGLSTAGLTSSNQHPRPDEWRPLSEDRVGAVQQFLRFGPGADARIAELRDALRRHLEAVL